jgi:mycofactocin glycosyltransferase
MTGTDLPKVSIVVPAFNAGVTIEACVNSLLALRYPRELLEIIVVDNNSADATSKMLDRYSGEVVLHIEMRRGPAAARNAGVCIAGGDVIAFTDADCTVDPGWLLELVRPLGDSAVGITGGRIRARPGANEAELYGETIHDHRASILVWRPPYVITMNWASRRAVLEEVGLFDERFRRGEDVDLSYRIGRAGYSLVYCSEAVVYHRNERSLLGLWREGLQHGFCAVDVRARHAAYIIEARSSSRREPRPAVVLDSPSRYGRAFRTGKRIGAVMGEARFRLRRARPPTDFRV